ncbi:MAG: DUF3488 and transglutaminase-like domain-containing protein [Brooklawnia sp.]|uniref:transglutaminase family protein n=1 Tax=Brooklawnia sp. TaxID=2699740 RepID=UPI003C7101B2
MTGSPRNTIAVAVAAFLGAIPMLALTRDDRFLPGVVMTVLLVQVAAALVRRLTPRAAPPTAAQVAVVLVGFLVVGRATVPSAATAADNGPASVWQMAVTVFRSAQRHMEEQSAPMASDDATLVVLLLAVAVLTIMIDVSFIAARSALLAAMPLLGGYLVATIVLDDRVRPVAMVAVCTGWLVLLASRTVDHERRWPRGLSKETGAKLNVRGFLRLALVLGVGAIAIALAAGTLVPSTRRDLWTDRTGTGTVQLTDPSIQLNENLRRPDDRPLLSYTTTAPGGVMLRSSALTRVDADGWHQIDMSLQRGFPARVPGVAGTQATDATQVIVGDFESNYLPAPYAPVGWQVEGEWNYDPASLTVLNVDPAVGPQVLTDLAFSVEHRNAEPTAEQLVSAVAGTPPEGAVAAEVPQDVPVVIAELAAEITADADSDGRRAIALQDWLRDPERFTYTLNAPSGTGYDSLVNFLTRDRAGYCVHYAGAMSLMARTLGIPSRVAVGFTTGTQQADGSWLVTSHNMHAWPELFFQGLGWVRFEPTVSVGSAPSWTNVPEEVDEPAESEPTPTFEPAPAPSQQPQVPVDGSGDQSAGLTVLDWRWVLGVAGGLLLLAAPALARLVQRGVRLRAIHARATVMGAWWELRATVVDLGLEWPDGTPRQVAAAPWPGLDDRGRAALERIAVLVERLYYAPGLPAQVQVRQEVELVSEQLRSGQSRWTRTWTRVAPRSLVLGRRI